VDHLNSKQHLHAVGERDEVVVATLEMVVERLAWLKRRREEEGRDGEEVDLARRLADRARAEEEERVQRREKRKVARRERKERERKLGKEGDVEGGDGDGKGGGEEEDPDAVAMARMMGFAGGFGTTKKRS
jgi:U4/U6.U5 tri-snRNP component SNU23